MSWRLRFEWGSKSSPSFANSSSRCSQTIGRNRREQPQQEYEDFSPALPNPAVNGYPGALIPALLAWADQWSYGFSKLLTDSDTYYANAGFAEDQGNRRLEESIGADDQTHVVKLNTLYDLPFGKGRRWLTRGFAAQALGDVSLGKSFPMSERFRLDFRAEAFNLLNRTVFGSPTTNLNSNSFGVITSQSNSPRQIQLALKLYW